MSHLKTIPEETNGMVKELSQCYKWNVDPYFQTPMIQMNNHLRSHLFIGDVVSFHLNPDEVIEIIRFYCKVNEVWIRGRKLSTTPQPDIIYRDYPVNEVFEFVQDSKNPEIIRLKALANGKSAVKFFFFFFFFCFFVLRKIFKIEYQENKNMESTNNNIIININRIYSMNLLLKLISLLLLFIFLHS